MVGLVLYIFLCQSRHLAKSLTLNIFLQASHKPAESLQHSRKVSVLWNRHHTVLCTRGNALHILSPIPFLNCCTPIHLLPQSSIGPCGLIEFYPYVSNDKLQALTLSTFSLTAFAISGTNTLYMLFSFLSFFLWVVLQE